MSWTGLIPNATPNTIVKAFWANAVAAAFVVAITVQIRSQLEMNKVVDPGLQLFIVMVIAIVASLLTYGLLYLLVGYGSSMVGDNNFKSLK